MSVPQIFDRALLRRRRDRIAGRFAAHDFLQRAATEALLDRLADVRRTFRRALELGGRTGLAAAALAARPGTEWVVRADLSPRLLRAGGAGPALAADEEWLPFAPGSFDLILSPLALHWVNDVPGAMAQIRRTLAPDGLFLCCCLGLGTLEPLRRALLQAETEVRGGASPRVSPFPDLADLARLLLRAGFLLPVADEETLTVAYADPLRLLADLRGMGAAAALTQRDPRPPGRAFWARALELLAAEAGPEGLAVPFRLLFGIGWAPPARAAL